MLYPSDMRTAKTVSITLPPDLLVKAQSYAEREHRTMSELFREALRRYMSADPEWEPSSPALGPVPTPWASIPRRTLSA